jgi:transcriptional regulator with XRE-family HTH domain
MEKSLHSKAYHLFLRHLRDARKRAGLTQVELARRLGETQSFVSKVERGERRIDVVELRAFCKAIGVSFSGFAQALDRNIG